MKTIIKKSLLLLSVIVTFTSVSNAQKSPFQHGVASGDPLSNAVIIWTRVSTGQQAATVKYFMASDNEMKNIVKSGTVTTDGSKDFTVKVDVTGLDAAKTYYYRFETNGCKSVIGRTKTAPSGSANRLKFAIISCSNYQAGYFEGYAKIAERNDLDAVIHLGDYIYEYQDNGYGSDEVVRPLQPNNECIKLDDYRKRYAHYRTDKNLQRAHQQHAFINIWDDHESANDAWMNGAENHDPTTEGDWNTRLANAKKAYYEWLPIRVDVTVNPLYRTLNYGNLADIILLDTRIEGRDQQINDATNPAVYSPTRTLLGNTQKNWLKNQLKNSSAKWKIVGNQVIFSEFNVGWAGSALVPPQTPEQVESIFLDIWDGYPAERDTIIDYITNNSIDNIAFLTGDFHSTFAFDVASRPSVFSPGGVPNYNASNGSGSVAVEFATPSISAANFDENLDGATALGLELQINNPLPSTAGPLAGVNPNPHMKFVDLDRHGYFVLDITPDSLKSNYYYINDILSKNSGEQFGKALKTLDGQNHLVNALESTAGTNAPTTPVNAQDNIMISEIMYNPKSSENDWEWVEITNIGKDDIDLAGWVIDDKNSSLHSTPNISSGTIKAGASAVLYNADKISATDFEAAWGSGINLIAATNWNAMALGNGGDRIGIWNSFTNYISDTNSTGDLAFNLSIDDVEYDDRSPWPSDAPGTSSIYVMDLNQSNDSANNWDYSAVGFNGWMSTTGGGNSGEDIASPGKRGKGSANLASVITLLHNNDGESKLLNAGSGQTENFGNVAAFKSLVDQCKNESKAQGVTHVMLSSGDNFLAGPSFNASLNRSSSLPYYDAVAIDSIGYDALCIGNHDFDFGPQVLANFISDISVSKPLFLSANLDFSGESSLNALVNNGRIAKSTIITRNGDSIGVIALTTEQLPFISSPGKVKVDPDYLNIVNNEITSLKTQGINKIILISHLQSLSEEKALATELSDIDVIIAGGGDELLANDGDLLVPNSDGTFPTPADSYPVTVQDKNSKDVHIVTTEGNYKYLGKLVLGFDANGEVVQVFDESRPVRVAFNNIAPDAVEENSGLKINVIDSVNAYLEDLASNIIATSNVPLDGRRSSVRTKESNEGNLLADAILWSAQKNANDFGAPVPQIALQNGGGIRNDEIIPAGDFSELKTFDIAPFSNFVTVLDSIDVIQLKEILENAYSSVEFGSGRFAQIAGLTVVYNPEGTRQTLDGTYMVTQKGGRIMSAKLNDGTPLIENGLPVTNAPKIIIATINFLATGGDQYPFRNKKYWRLGETYQQALYNYIISTDGLNGTISSTQYPETPAAGKERINANTPAFTLTLLHNNDGESKLINAGSGESENYGGIASFVKLAKKLQSEATHDITLSSGDNFLAGPNFSAGLNNTGGKIYDAIAIDDINYDAICIGNHDFDFGPSTLAKFITDMDVNQPTFLSANLDFSNDADLNPLFTAGRIAPSKIVDYQGTKVGVIGLTTEQLPYISSPGKVTVNGDYVNIINTQIANLKGQGANIIVLISHLQSINEDKDLASQIKDVDVMIAGGGDDLLANPGDLLVPNSDGTFPTPVGPYPTMVKDANGNDLPIVTTEGNYKYIGRLVVNFDSNGDLVAIDGSSAPVRVSNKGVDSIGIDDNIFNNVVTPVLNYNSALAANVLANSSVVLDGRRSSVRQVETNQGNLMADALLWTAKDLYASFGAAEPQVAIQNGGGIRNDELIPSGDITELKTFEMAPFANYVTIVEAITPQQFKEIMENCVSRHEDVSGRFGQISGFDFIWDTAGTAQVLDNNGNVTTQGSRVWSIILEDGTEIVKSGAVVSGAPNVNFATINFLATGGDQYPFRDNKFTSLGVTYQKSIADYITSANGLNGSITAAQYPEGGENRITTKDNSSVSKINNVNFFNVYPNPSENSFHFVIESKLNSNTSIQIIDNAGRTIHTQSLDLSKTNGKFSISANEIGMAKGVYSYNIKSSAFSISGKLFVK